MWPRGPSTPQSTDRVIRIITHTTLWSLSLLLCYHLWLLSIGIQLVQWTVHSAGIWYQYCFPESWPYGLLLLRRYRCPKRKSNLSVFLQHLRKIQWTLSPDMDSTYREHHRVWKLSSLGVWMWWQSWVSSPFITECTLASVACSW